MRKLILSDAFKMARILKTAEIKDELSKLATKFGDTKNKKTNVNEIGLEVILTLISASGNEDVESQIYELLAGVMETTPEEIKNLSISGLKDIIVKIIKENDLGSFFKSASSLI